MANIIAQYTLDNGQLIVSVDADPTIGGLDIPAGSVAFLEGAPGLWIKGVGISTVWGSFPDSAASAGIADARIALARGAANGIAALDGSQNIDALTKDLVNVGLVDGVDVSSHAARHLPSGADPLTTATAIGLDATSTNTLGSAESFSKSDHTHDLATGVVSAQTPDQANSEGSSVNLARADHIHNIPSATPVQIGTSNFVGAAASFALSDHVHSHGNQTAGTLHAAATSSVNGFMAATDKVILDAATAVNTPSTIVKRDGSGNFAAGTITAALTGAASANLLKAGDSMTGYFRSAVVALTDAATITTDAALGNVFTVTLGGNRILGAPTNPLNGQKITYRIRQDATGGRTLTYNTVFNFPPSLIGLSLSTSANAFDYIGMQYNSATSKWDVLAFTSGLT